MVLCPYCYSTNSTRSSIIADGLEVAPRTVTLYNGTAQQQYIISALHFAQQYVHLLTAASIDCGGRVPTCRATPTSHMTLIYICVVISYRAAKSDVSNSNTMLVSQIAVI